MIINDYKNKEYNYFHINEEYLIKFLVLEIILKKYLALVSFTAILFYLHKLEKKLIK